MFGYCQVYMITDGGVPVHVIQVSITYHNYTIIIADYLFRV